MSHPMHPQLPAWKVSFAGIIKLFNGKWDWCCRAVAGHVLNYNEKSWVEGQPLPLKLSSSVIASFSVCFSFLLLTIVATHMLMVSLLPSKILLNCPLTTIYDMRVLFMDFLFWQESEWEELKRMFEYISISSLFVVLPVHLCLFSMTCLSPLPWMEGFLPFSG